MRRLGKYFEDYTKYPEVLMEALWFYLCYFFGRRGREGWPAMTKKTFEVNIDSEGKKYVSMSKTECTKNFQGVTNSRI